MGTKERYVLQHLEERLAALEKVIYGEMERIAGDEADDAADATVTTPESGTDVDDAAQGVDDADTP